MHQFNHGLIGYYSDASQPRDQPTHDPGLAIDCPICNMILGEDPEQLRTIGLMIPGGSRSYFYRVHRHCHSGLTTQQQKWLDDMVIEMIVSTA